MRCMVPPGVRWLEALNLQCNPRSRCRAELERYFKRVRYFPEESVEILRDSLFGDVIESHPDVKWSRSGKSVVVTLPKFFRDNSPATFRRSVSILEITSLKLSLLSQVPVRGWTLALSWRL